ncbi:MAG: hypothetical protein P4M15_01365 [Alphaproteobacteria bacterium]|nr:hypothetical protein [Alphaproteobacteria bacterium]
MHKFLTFLVLLAVLLGSASAFARGGRTDDCPPGSTDPDCVATPAPGK